MKIPPRSKVVLIGDSITDAERAKPVGEGLFGALGKGYVSQIDAILTATSPGDRIRLVNMGNSGNTVLDLTKRWQTDVLDLQPNWLSIMIGINDVWRQFDSPWQTDGHVSLEIYRHHLEELVSKTRPLVQGMVLMSPFVIEPNRADAMRSQMDRYGAVGRELAEKYDAIFVDVQAAFDVATEHLHPTAIAWDRIHPGAAGHMMIARAFLQAVDFEWE